MISNILYCFKVKRSLENKMDKKDAKLIKIVSNKNKNMLVIKPAKISVVLYVIALKNINRIKPTYNSP